MSILDRYLMPSGESASEHRRANREQRRQLLQDAPIRDIEDLIPVLAEKAKISREAARRAEEELAEALLVSEAKKEAARGRG